MVQRYVLGQGKVWIDEKDPTTGLPMGKARFVGNVPSGGLTFQMTTQQVSHFESYTGQNLKDLEIERQKDGKGMIRLEDFVKENIMLALYGSSTALAGATISSETHNAYSGKSFFLNRINLTSFTSLTNNGATTTYVNGTDYTVDLKSGTVTILEDGDISDESVVKANYVAGTSERVTTFSTPNKEYWLRFNGVNNADNDNPIILEAFKVRFYPAKNFDLLNDNQFANLEMDFSILYDETLADTSGYEGGFFRFMQTQA